MFKLIEIKLFKLFKLLNYLYFFFKMRDKVTHLDNKTYILGCGLICFV